VNLRRWLAILAFGGVLLLGACGGGSKHESSDAPSSQGDATTTTAGSASGAAAHGKACGEYLTKADVESQFGTGFGDAKDTSNQFAQICEFERQDPFATVQFVIKPTSAGEYDATVNASKGSGVDAQSVSGIGDKATQTITTKYGTTVVQVIAAKGNALFYITASSSGGSGGTQVNELAKLLANRL